MQPHSRNMTEKADLQMEVKLKKLMTYSNLSKVEAKSCGVFTSSQIMLSTFYKPTQTVQEQLLHIKTKLTHAHIKANSQPCPSVYLT